MKLKKFLVIFLAFALCFTFFMATAFVFSRKVLLGVDVPKNDVPYVDGIYLPADTTVLFTFSDNVSIAMELLFSENFTNILMLNGINHDDFLKHGYEIDHTVECNYSFLMKFIDILGGIELDSENFLLTGVQVCNLLADTSDSHLKTEILKSIINKISKNGLSEELLYCIIENTNTTLSAPSCYNWNVWVGECLKSYNIIDGRQNIETTP